jgi:hypothetical protein
MKTLFTNVYHGELVEGEHKATLKEFTFTIFAGLKFRANAKVFAQAVAAFPKNFDFSGNSIKIPFELIPALFNTEYEPAANSDYFTEIFDIEGREFKKNLFERDFAVFLKQTRIQLTGANLEDIQPFDWIKSLIGKEISVWVKYQNVPTRNHTISRVQNINYCPPLENPEDATDSTNPEEEKPF